MPRNAYGGSGRRPGRRLPYREGDWFAVPLRDHGYAVGVVARSAPGGDVLLGYFFGPRRPSVPALAELEPLKPRDAILLGRFGDLSLRNGEWPIIGQRASWNRAEWPMPTLARFDAVSGQARLIEYDDDDPLTELRETPVPGEIAERHPRDGLMGAGSVELTLTDLLTEHERTD